MKDVIAFIANNTNINALKTAKHPSPDNQKKQTWNNANENKCKKKINCFVKNMCKIPINPYEQFLFTINCWKLNNTLK